MVLVRMGGNRPDRGGQTGMSAPPSNKLPQAAVKRLFTASGTQTIKGRVQIHHAPLTASYSFNSFQQHLLHLNDCAERQAGDRLRGRVKR